jgi:hypothetical protein
MKPLQWVILGAAVLLSVAMLTTASILRARNSADNSADASRPTYTITFCDTSGTELLKRTVQEDAFAVPPDTPQHGESEVFLGWGNPLYPVTADATCQPQFQKVSSGENVVFADTVYVETGKETTVSLKIGGQVALDQLELELHYNPDLLSFRSADSGFGEVQNENGKVTFTLAADESLRTPGVLADITFKAIGDAFTIGEISFETLVAKSGNSDATFGHVKAKVYIYK